MSWRGVKKSISRLPHQFKTRNGGGDDVTRDKEYLALEAEYKDFIKSSEQLFSETIAYRDSLAGILEHQLQCANYLTEIYNMSDESSEYKDLPTTTKQALEDYATAMTYCREETMALLDELDARVVRPFDQYHLLVKAIEKTMMKRQHKLIDFDRHRVSYIKFSAIAEPSPSEERNMLKLQAQYETASHDYNYFNDMLKNDLVAFLELSSEFIQPILDNFFDLQYRIIGGFYGRIYEVIQHNQSFLPTLDMPIDEGFIFRLSQVNAGEEIENSDLVKKGLKSWERTTTTSRSNTSSSLSYGKTIQQDNNGDHLSMQGHPVINRTISNQSSNSSLYNNRERPSYVSGQNNMSSTSYQNNNEQRQQTLPYTPTPPPLLPKPSLSPAVSYYAKSATASPPPPLAKKPILAPRPSFTNKAQNVTNTPPPIRRPSGSPVTSSSFENFDKAKSIIQNHQQGKSPSVSDIKFGHQVSKNLSSSSLNKSSIVTPPPAVVELNNPFFKKSSPPPPPLSSSPFADQQQQEVIKKKRTPPPPPPSRGSCKKEYVEALYDLNATLDGDLSFAFGDRIEVIEKSDKSDDWWKGRIGTHVGMFPANYVRQI